MSVLGRYMKAGLLLITSIDIVYWNSYITTRNYYRVGKCELMRKWLEDRGYKGVGKYDWMEKL